MWARARLRRAGQQLWLWGVLLVGFRHLFFTPFPCSGEGSGMMLWRAWFCSTGWAGAGEGGCIAMLGFCLS